MLVRAVVACFHDDGAQHRLGSAGFLGRVGQSGFADIGRHHAAAFGEAAAFTATDYKALVCVFLYGGNDYANTVIPYDNANYDLYSRIRGGGANRTAGGIAYALPLLGDDPFIAVNADVYSDYDFAALLLAAQRLRETGPLAHLVLVPNPPHNLRGDFGLVGGRMIPACAESFTFSGLSVLRPELFADCTPGAFPLAPLLRDAAIRGRVSAELHAGLWSDVGTPERLAAIETLLSSAPEKTA
mgnify:CR=1 FL=1